MTDLEVQRISVLSDNYVYLCHDRQTGVCAVVDPSIASPVTAALERLGWKLTHILNTHAHHDHTGGNLDLKRSTGCTVVGSRLDAEAIPGLDLPVGDGDTVKIGSLTADVFHVPGHTAGHVAYWFEDGRALFCGDTLFALGCGRLFGGTPRQMWSSLDRLRALPDDAVVYGAHEYTRANAEFALTVDPQNRALRRRAAEVRALDDAGKPIPSSTMAEERAANPFLRADDEDLKRAVGLADNDAVEVFAEIRRRKDRF